MSGELTLFPLDPPVISPFTLAEPREDLWGYFLATRNGNRVKHGVSTDLPGRRRRLQTGNPEPLVLTGAYPAYSVTLEDAVKAHFRDLRTAAENEWFEPWTVEFIMTALGGGIPPLIWNQWLDARAERMRLLAARSGTTVQANVTRLLASEDYREARELDRHIAGAVQDLVDSSTFEAMQPLQVRMQRLWARRCSGEAPFDVAAAELKPAPVDLSKVKRR